MTFQVSIRGLPRAIIKLRKYKNGTPIALREGQRRWGNKLVGNMRLALQPHNWTGKTSASVRWKQGKNKGELWIRQAGIFLDSMIPHFVALKRGRKITKWAREKGLMGKGIYVRPHPYINRILLNHIPRLDKYIMNEIVRKAR